MENSAEDSLGSTALACGGLSWFLYFVSLCLGFIPFISLINLLLLPVTLILDLAALGTGFTSWRRVGAGKGLAGMLLGALHLLWFLVQIALVLLLGGTVVAMNVLAMILGANAN